MRALAWSLGHAQFSIAAKVSHTKKRCYIYLAIGRRITYIPSIEVQLVEKGAKRCLSVWSYFADVMLMYKRYQALRATYSRSRRAWERG